MLQVICQFIQLPFVHIFANKIIIKLQSSVTYIQPCMRPFLKQQPNKTATSTFDVLPINELPFKQEDIRPNGIATNSIKNNNKKTAIFNPNVTTRSQIWYQDEESNKKQVKRKRTIEKYINELTSDIEATDNYSDLGQYKFKALKRIIQYYDIKTMQKTDYSKLIKTFGLRIQSVHSSPNDRKQIRTHNEKRYFRLKAATRGDSRLAKIKNQINLKQGKDNGQVALLSFSKQLRPVSRQSQSSNNRIMSERLSSCAKQRSKKKWELNLKQKTSKLSPFKFKCLQDIIIEKLNRFRQFLFILNSSNHLYRNMNFNQYPKQLKFYIGHGNNSNLIKSLMKKRYYFVETKNIKEANFIWTQIKVDEIFKQQTNAQPPLLTIKEEVKTSKKPIFHTVFKSYLTQENLVKIIRRKQIHPIMIMKEKLFNKIMGNSNIDEKLKYFQHLFVHKEFTDDDKIHNHLPSNGLLGNKKGMFYCIREYYKITGRNVWDILPLTFHITSSFMDNSFKQFVSCFNERKKNKYHNIWIMKPGQFSNRGNGISCSNKLQEIRKRVSKCHSSKHGGEEKTLILQLYITNPLLYNNRKFDIRAYMLVTCHNGKIKGYWYEEGYIRTSSYIFNLNELADNDIHLTNDAIQKQSQSYGKFEPGNKLSYGELQRYLYSLPTNGRNMNFFEYVLPKMKSIAAQSLKSSFLFLDKSRKQNNFEIFGLDFMIDTNLKPWLIQINTNPCLELSCPLLERIIPHMAQNALRIGLDTIFPPPNTVPHNYKYNIPQNALHYNRFQLIFDQEEDGASVAQLFMSYPESSSFISSLMNIKQDQEEYKQEGKLCDYDV